jgi:hypothetical protein
VSTEPENPPLAVDPVGVPRKRSLTHRSADQPLSAAAAPPAVSRRRAHIYWDYATISPRSLGVPPSDFLDGLVHVFQRTFNICCGEVRCVVYLTGSREDENELRELGALLRFVRVVERSDAAVVFETCKALDCDLQQLIEENLEENVTLLDVVLVSNEANFNAAKGILRECGMHVHAVHDSVTVLEEANFSRGCSTTTDVKRLPCVLRAQQRPAESLRSSRSRSNGSLNEERSSYLAANQSFSSKGCESDNDERYL